MQHQKPLLSGLTSSKKLPDIEKANVIALGIPIRMLKGIYCWLADILWLKRLCY